jgi:EmrB/QacA subfamily drug resistance transporter
MFDRRWLTLTLLATAQFMVVLDLTIVNVALPHIQAALGFSNDGLQWVVSAYTLLFGGFLLLGGRAADLLGRRAVFSAGLGLFTLASLVAGLATSPGMMIAARAAQGLGGAMLSPAALSLLTVTFAHGRERNIALGIWGALAGLGGTLGVVAGGVLVDALGWKWVFFVNVPIGAALVLATLRLVPESRIQRDGRRNFDLPGAVLGTAGMLSLVYGIVRTEVVGWGSVEVIACLAAAAVVLAGFVVAELRASDPLVPPRLFRAQGLRIASLALGLNGAGFLAVFFLTALYLQQVRGDSALLTGVQLLPMGVAAILAAVTVSELVTRVGTRAAQVGGAALSLAGLLLLSRVGATSAYATSLLPGFVLFGAGIIAIGVPAQIAAVAEVREHDAGAASGVVTACYQVGGALGLAVITTIADSRVTHLLAGGASQAHALTAGFQRGIVIAAAIAAINLIVAALSPRIAPDAGQVAVAAATG